VVSDGYKENLNITNETIFDFITQVKKLCDFKKGWTKILIVMYKFKLQN
jgi:hypothetical protein